MPPKDAKKPNPMENCAPSGNVPLEPILRASALRSILKAQSKINESSYSARSPKDNELDDKALKAHDDKFLENMKIIRNRRITRKRTCKFARSVSIVPLNSPSSPDLLSSATCTMPTMPPEAKHKEALSRTENFLNELKIFLSTKPKKTLTIADVLLFAAEVGIEVSDMQPTDSILFTKAIEHVLADAKYDEAFDDSDLVEEAIRQAATLELRSYETSFPSGGNESPVDSTPPNSGHKPPHHIPPLKVEAVPAMSFFANKRSTSTQTSQPATVSTRQNTEPLLN
ncbi:MAG: hypothetical protein A3F18_01495 [Legionellales bacterium RIFCSPHIGHO2_12_FULL_37_14]|nr:MAG: hypothetical protein A3F18_01495 [Legionellales bacterium RIFCSPHIGHO2_12_FULL_37_14]